jgi:hypothetical protein
MRRPGETRRLPNDNRAMSIRALACLSLLAALASPGGAATITVGPGGDVPRFSMAVQRAIDGDVIEILPGEYVGDVAVLTQRRLHIRGIGARPVFVAAGHSAEGKAIWVVRNGDITIENVEFRGARVPDGNGAGIRFERGRLRVQACVFLDNEMGLLTGNAADAEIVVRDSEFGLAPTLAGALHHLLYIGRIARAEIGGNHFHQGYRGHLIKSRARVTRIVDNTIVDGPLGQASYEIDLPNGGLALVSNNRIGQAAATGNHAMLSFGAEGNAWPASRLVMRRNMFINDGPPSDDLVRVWWSRLPPGARADSRGDRLIGPGVLAPLTR